MEDKILNLDNQMNIDIIQEAPPQVDFFNVGNAQKHIWLHNCQLEEVTLKAIMIQEIGQKSNEIIFNIKSNGFLEQGSVCIEFYVVNASTNPIQLDSSAHSMFNRVEIAINSQVIEDITDYDMINAFFSEIRITREEKFRRQDEGFALNSQGDDEMIIWPIGYETMDKSIKQQEFLPNNIAEEEDFDNKKAPEGTRVKVRIDSAIFGKILNQRNWKIIPLVAMDIKVVIRLSSVFGFVPFCIDSSYDFYSGYAEFIEKNKYRNNAAKVKIAGNADDKAARYWLPVNSSFFEYCKIIGDTGEPFKSISNDYSKKQFNSENACKIITPVLKFTKVMFDDDFATHLTKLYAKEGLYFPYEKIELLSKTFIYELKSASYIQFKPKKTYDIVRAIYFFCSFANQDSGMVRKWAKRNTGFSTMQVNLENDELYPPESITKNIELYNAGGKRSVLPIYRDLCKLAAVPENKRKILINNKITYDNLQISPKDISSWYDYTVVMYYFFCKPNDRFWNLNLDNVKQMIMLYENDVLRKNKSLNMIKFDNVPYKNDEYVGGIKLDVNMLTSITLKKSNAGVQVAPFKYLETYSKTFTEDYKTKFSEMNKSFISMNADVLKENSYLYLLVESYTGFVLFPNGTVTFANPINGNK